MSMLDIIGPVMVGPSSSHTAGAVRLGLLARQTWAKPITSADLYLRGSFAATYWGHGTDRGLLAGLMGLQPDDPQIVNAFQLADELGLEYHFYTEDDPGGHPNTARFVLTNGQSVMELIGCSVGGGMVLLTSINGFDVAIDGMSTTLVVPHRDQPGIISALSSEMTHRGINIASMRLSRKFRGDQAVAVMEVDSPVDEPLRKVLEASLPEDCRVLVIQPLVSGGAA